MTQEINSFSKTVPFMLENFSTGEAALQQSFNGALSCAASPLPMARLDVEKLPLEEVETMVRAQNPEFVNAVKDALEMVEEAKSFLQATESTISPSIKVRLSGVLDAMTRLLETFLDAFGIEDFFKPSNDKAHAQTKGQRILLILTLFTTVSALLIPVLGPALAGAIVGGTLLAIVALSIIYPHIRPMLSQLPYGSNWTLQCKKGNLPQVSGRKESVDEIADALRQKQHVIIHGKLGMGTTETIQALTQAVERGDYPELQGKQVIYFNMADLTNANEQGQFKILGQIKEAMAHHRDRYILVFDKMHVACRKSTTFADQLETLLNSGSGNFSYVIGMATDKEFLAMSKTHPTFAERFKKIDVKNTDDAETVRILKNDLLRKAPHLILEQGALESLIAKAKETSGSDALMPMKAQKLLSQCVQKMTTAKSPLEEQVDQLRSRIATVKSYGGADRLALLKQDLKKLEKNLYIQKREIEQFFQEQSRLTQLRREACLTALKIAAIGSEASSREQASLLRLRYGLIPTLEARVQARAAELPVPVVLNRKFVESTV